MALARDLGEVVKTTVHLIAFRRVRIDVARLGTTYVAFGIVLACLAGIGRYWTHPDAETWQYAGLGSVAYVFFMAGWLWLLIMPLGPQNWSYRNVLVFVSLTSAPAFVYAIPVERFMPLEQASATNGWLLALVATWRVGLLAVYLKRSAGLRGGRLFVAVCFPLTIVVVALTMLNLEHVTFDLMEGVTTPTAADDAFGAIFLMSLVSVLSFPFLLIAYLYYVIRGAIT